MLPRVNADGNPVDKDGNEYDKKNPKQWVQAIDPVTFYLLHWGLEYILLQDENGKPYGINYTVGICQEMQSGAIRTFLPAELRVIGVESK
jgi:hypothetical protein